jgi:primosomal protein N' (replication factor Y) (superfamily II helicase)
MPPVSVVDLSREKKMWRLKGAVSHPLREAIASRLERGEQVILLQNRRGYAPIVACDSCGWAPRCQSCAVSMTYHKTKRHLRCHYCGRTSRLPESCPKCGAEDLAQLGAGTQRVEEELAALYPHARLLRMDLDTTGRRDAHRKLLDSFGRGDADILIGTQMVAKGLDFARVTLVGVVDADTGMLMPDFRAAERTFQLLMQVAGRAGRGDLPGEVILQTRNPTHPAIRFALAHDLAGFVEHETDERRIFGYPPFGRLVGIEFKGAEEAKTHRLATEWTEYLREAAAAADPDLDVLGPEAAFIGRIKGQYRFHSILKAGRQHGSSAIASLVRGAGQRFGSVPKDYRVNVDVDPMGLF